MDIASMFLGIAIFMAGLSLGCWVGGSLGELEERNKTRKGKQE